MSKFSWSYPAGCNSTPYDDFPPEDCPVCGKVLAMYFCSHSGEQKHSCVSSSQKAADEAQAQSQYFKESHE